MIENECCICLNKIEITDDNIFILECCSQVVHHECIVTWINASIDRNLPDYNKCILCRTTNKSIHDYHNEILTNRNNNTYINLDSSNNNYIIIGDLSEEEITSRNRQLYRNKLILFSFIFATTTCLICTLGVCAFLIIVNKSI